MRLFTLPFSPGHSTALPCPWSRAVIEISLFSSLPPPQQLPFSLVFVAFFFFPLLFSSFSKCCWLSTWAEEEVKAEETNAGCHIAGVGWDREGSPASCPVPRGRRDCQEPLARWGHGGDAYFCSTEEKSLFCAEKNPFSILMVLCRGGSRAAERFPTRAPATAWSQRLAWDISR